MKAYDLVIENAKVLTMDENSTVIENGIIGIKDGSISFLDKKRPGECASSGRRIDAHGMVALPGFVNTHVHCFQSLLKGLGADLPLIGWLNRSV